MKKQILEEENMYSKYAARVHPTERLTPIISPETPLKAKYKKLRFKTEQEFKRWLNEKYTQKINLFDAGDISTIWIDEEGEILHCDFHGSLYNGCFVDLSTLKEDKPLRIFVYGKWKVFAGLVPESIVLKK